MVRGGWWVTECPSVLRFKQGRVVGVNKDGGESNRGVVGQMEGWWVKRQGGGQECPCISSEGGGVVPLHAISNEGGGAPPSCVSRWCEGGDGSNGGGGAPLSCVSSKGGWREGGGGSKGGGGSNGGGAPPSCVSSKRGWCEGDGGSSGGVSAPPPCVSSK